MVAISSYLKTGFFNIHVILIFMDFMELMHEIINIESLKYNFW